MKSAQTFPLQHGYIPSRLPTETHTKDCTAHYTTQHRNASSATPPSLSTQRGSFSLSPQSLHFSLLSTQMLFHHSLLHNHFLSILASGKEVKRQQLMGSLCDAGGKGCICFQAQHGELAERGNKALCCYCYANVCFLYPNV